LPPGATRHLRLDHAYHCEYSDRLLEGKNQEGDLVHVSAGAGSRGSPPRIEVLFVSTAKMLAHMAGGRADETLAYRLARYLRP